MTDKLGVGGCPEGRRPFLPAVVSPAAAYSICKGFGRQIEESARARLAYDRADKQGLEMLGAVAVMRESGRQWMEGLRAEQAGERGDVLDGSDGRWLTTIEAAAVLGVSTRRVCVLARDRVIWARRRGQRAWELDEADVLEYRVRRRRLAS